MQQPGATIFIESKLVGRRKPLFPDWRIPLPPEYTGGGAHITVRDIITHVVREEVEAFLRRQEQRRLIHVLTAHQIEQGALSGKVDMGERDLQQPVNADEAVGAALQAFQDGLYYVFIDNEQQIDLAHVVYVHSDSRVTFIRLVALAGG